MLIKDKELRNWFAGMAMQALAIEHEKSSDEGPIRAHYLAVRSYQIADAMLLVSGTRDEALELAKSALTHSAPGDCWATGPKTGNLFEDMVVCPGCRALAAIDRVLP